MWQTHRPGTILEFAAGLPARLGLEGAVHCAPWREGASNAVWKLDIGSFRGVLKVGKLEDWRRQSVEARVLSRFDGRHAPRHRLRGPAGDGLPWDWSVLERIEGRHPERLDLPSTERLGEALRALRQVDSAVDGDRLGWKDFAEDRIRSVVSKAGSAPPEVVERFDRLVEVALGPEMPGPLLDALPGGVVHGDLIPPNVVEDRQGIMWVLDWENPRWGSICWDLASIRKTFPLLPGAWDALVRSVGEAVPLAALDFADALQQLQVAAWRVETWWDRDIRSGGDFFLEEMSQELSRAETLLGRLR